MECRNFKLDTEWNIVHYSDIPNGFGILIIGDERHFVDEKRCFWTQNEGKQLLLNQLKQNGYTIFYSNLYGRHWGNKRSSMMAERLYHHIMRSEILNTKIHIIAEGMGALIALDLMKSMDDKIRSIVFINPIFSLKTQLELEKEQKFFYKKLLREIAIAYNNDLQSLENQAELPEVNEEIPIKIIHVLSDRRSYQQLELSKQVARQWEQQNSKIQFCFLVPEKKQRIGSMMTSFFKENEKEL
jgi:hypothetical protein